MQLAQGWSVDVDRGPDWLFITLRCDDPSHTEPTDLAENLWELAQCHLVNRMVIDLQEMPLLSSALLGQFTQLGKRMHSAQGVLRLCGVPVGGEQSIKADVRMVVATNRDLEAMVREGTFRQDLFFRLNVVSLKTIPLRERPEDILLLANHFLERFSAENNLSIRGFDDAALECMLAYCWPGNVRELANAVERAVIMSTTPIILAENLPENVVRRSDPLNDPQGDAMVLPDGQPIRPLREMVGKFEAQIIEMALGQNEGNRARTAVQLGISRRALQYKLQDYGIS